MTFLNNQFFTIIFMISMFTIISCGDDDAPAELKTTEFQYNVHNGQAVPSAPYGGIHGTDLSATMALEELEDNQTMITVTLSNTISGAIYHMHAHDAADASSTPNGTPYNETPNSDIFAQMLQGNGSSVSVSQVATISYDELISDYAGFFVIHDPLQSISTVDISTYLVVGGFARIQDLTEFRTSTFDYNFNTGQLVSDFAYSGDHNEVVASIRVDELADNQSRIVVSITNTIEGEMYHTHAHDMADPTSTPNGTPYIESPNAQLYAAPLLGNGGTARLANISTMDYDAITTGYDGFLVVHDPLQAITTVDPTTYIILGVFAR